VTTNLYLDNAEVETVFPATGMPGTLLRFIWRFSRWHQLALVVMSTLIFLLEAAPLELQRRIVNDAFKGGNYIDILVMALIYLGMAFGQGLLKMLTNIYRSWVGEKAIRSLRLTVQTLSRHMPTDRNGAEEVGIETSMMLAEAEPVGAFVGAYFSEPLLQGGVLLSIFGYMAYLEPTMALVALVVFAPQLIFVPIMQAAINRRVARRITMLREVSGGMILDVTDESTGILKGLQMRRIEDVFWLDMGIFKLKFSMNFLMNLMLHIATAGVLAVGGWFVVNGQTQIGTVVAFLSGLSRLSDPWGDLVSWFRDLTVTATKYRLMTNAIGNIAVNQRRLDGCSARS
jgi:ABC-type multidrug transport system fused ATPase/permease subunit